MKFRGIFDARPKSGDPRLEQRSDRAKLVNLNSVSIVLVRCAAMILLALSGVSASARMIQHGRTPQTPHASAPAPHSSAPVHSQSSGSAHPSPPPHPPAQQHLNEWLQRNKGLSPQEQARKLQQEQGFRQLPPPQQQRLTNRLQQLNRMPPDQRQRTLERVENLERLSPQQQQQVRGSAARLGQMPLDRQQAMKEAIRTLRNVPPGLRQSELNSPRYTGQLTPEERGIVGNLLAIEPYHPPPPPQQ